MRERMRDTTYRRYHDPLMVRFFLLCIALLGNSPYLFATSLGNKRFIGSRTDSIEYSRRFIRYSSPCVFMTLLWDGRQGDRAA